MDNLTKSGIPKRKDFLVLAENPECQSKRYFPVPDLPRTWYPGWVSCSSLPDLYMLLHAALTENNYSRTLFSSTQQNTTCMNQYNTNWMLLYPGVACAHWSIRENVIVCRSVSVVLSVDLYVDTSTRPIRYGNHVTCPAVQMCILKRVLCSAQYFQNNFSR